MFKDLRKPSLFQTSDVEDSDCDDDYPIIIFNPSSSSSTSQSSNSQASQKPHMKKQSGANRSDSEESFKSLDSDDVDASDHEEPEGTEEPKPEKIAADPKEPEASLLENDDMNCH